MRVSLGADAARRNVDELITGLWTFANVLGLLTDIIGERTAAAGVTVDGLLIKDSGIPEAAVTAHEAALAILMAQVTGNIPDGQVPESAVTQHEAALSILETQIPDGSIFPRLANTEIITGLYVFSHSSGILVDTIAERVAAAGVTIDGVLLIDNSVRIQNKAAAGDTAVLSSVLGDGFNRFVRLADGQMEWGSGAATRDTNLFRNTANELKTDDSFTVGASLNVGTALVVSVNLIALTADVHDVSLNGSIQQRVTADSVWTISGFVAGVDGQMIYVVNADDSANMGLRHQDANSAAANRMILPGGVSFTININEGVWLVYDGVISRWRLLTI